MTKPTTDIEKLEDIDKQALELLKFLNDNAKHKWSMNYEDLKQIARLIQTTAKRRIGDLVDIQVLSMLINKTDKQKLILIQTEVNKKLATLKGKNE